MTDATEVAPIPADGPAGMLLRLPPRLPQATWHDPVAVYLDGLARGHSQETAKRSLRRVARLIDASGIEAVPWEQLRYPHYQALRAALEAATTAKGTRLTPGSANTALAALRGVAKAAWALGYIDAQELERIRSIRPVRGEALPAGRDARPGELRALLEACERDESPAGYRDAAIIALLYVTGMRRSELATLELSDYESDTGEIRIRSGKGRKARIVFAGSAMPVLVDWLEVRGDRPGRLFLPVNRGGNIRGEGMTAQAVYNALDKRVREARLGQPLTPHDLRRSMIGDALDAGADLSVVQKVAGHADPGTTARYDRRGARAVRRVSEELLHVPYVPRSQRRRG